MTTRVLVVDDSPTMRGLIATALQRHADIEVVGFAADPIEAREAIKRLEPDVLTLDVEMPNMNGLAFLERLMRLRPMPVVMVSTLTQAGADVTLAALELGAVDCVAKPSSSEAMREALEHLGDVVKNAARSRPRPPSGPRPSAMPQSEFVHDGSIVAIGASTGGVEALMTVLARYPANCPPTVITQHMPKSFTKSFAARLDAHCAARVTEAEDGARLMQGRVYLAPGGEQHLEVGACGSELVCRLREAPPVNGHRPSVDVLMHSVARSAPRSVGVILTGMGKDGAQGLKAMRDAGARTVAQDESTCVVYGMPRAAYEIGAAEQVAPLGRIGDMITELCSTKHRKVS